MRINADDLGWFSVTTDYEVSNIQATNGPESFRREDGSIYRLALSCGVGALGNRDGVVPHGFHHRLDIVGVGLAEGGFAKTYRVCLVG